MSEDNQQLLRDVAILYYEDNMTQAEIAKRFNLSRPKVSRLLSEAREKGIVKIFISNQAVDMSYIEERLTELYHLKAVKVVSVPPGDEELALQITAQEAAKFIHGFLEPNDCIGVSRGVTLNEIAKNLPSIPLSNVKVVQLSGNLDNADTLNYANDIVNGFASKLDAEAVYTIPCPIIVGNSIILDILLHDEKINKTMELASNCNKMIVNLGVPMERNCLYRSGYINDCDMERLRERNAVGSICCRFYDDKGNICDEQLDNRTMGVSLEAMKKAEYVISCIVGKHKAEALLGALRAGFLNVLIVDSVTATHVLELACQGEHHEISR